MSNTLLKTASFLLFLILSVQRSTAQTAIPVVKEPFHQVVFSNEYIRILDVHIPPGDTTLYHTHQTNSAIVFFSRNKTGSQILGGKPMTGQAVPGNTTYANFGDSPVSHRVWNSDTAVYHVFDIELVNHPHGSLGEILSNPGLTLAWDKKLARAYRVVLDPGKIFTVKGSDHPHLLIRISGSPQPFREGMSMEGKLRPIYFVWYPAGTGLNFTNKESVQEQCILLEMN
jgi:hypothetical protein